MLNPHPQTTRKARPDAGTDTSVDGATGLVQRGPATCFQLLHRLTGYSGSSHSVRRSYMRRCVFAAVAGLLSCIASFSLAGIIGDETIVLYCCSGVVAVLGGITMHFVARYMRVWLAALAAGLFLVRFASMLAIYIYIIATYAGPSAGYTVVLGPIEVFVSGYFLLMCVLLLICVSYLRSHNQVDEQEGRSIRLVDPWETSVPYAQPHARRGPAGSDPPPKLSDDFDDVFERIAPTRLGIIRLGRQSSSDSSSRIGTTESKPVADLSGTYTPVPFGDSPLTPSALTTPVTV